MKLRYLLTIISTFYTSVPLNAAQRSQPYIENNRYYNYKGEQPGDHLTWYQEIIIYTTAVVQRLLNITSRNPNFAHKESWLTQSTPAPMREKLSITWIGHSTFLIQHGNVNILTDPVFGDVCPVIYTRILQPGIMPQDLPSIDYVVVSHNHRDHMDEPSLRYLEDHNTAITFLVPKGDKAWYDQRGFKSVVEMEWWEQCEFTNSDNKKHTFTFLPARHWSHRYFFSKADINTSLWGSWMIEHDNTKIYFAGDTAFSDHFKEIGQAFQSIDIALLPIGPCEHREWMETTHIGPEEAGQAFLDLNAQQFIPMHWGTFYFGVDHFTTPVERTALWWNRHYETLKDKQIHFVKMGEELQL